MMDRYDVNQPVRLKKGVYRLNQERNFDYQLNRVINWDGGRIEDIKPIADRIRTSSDWKRELIALGDTAMEEGRTENAIAYYRMSEFFMYDGDPDKKAYYEKATKLFYEYYADYFEGDDPRIEKLNVPYENVKLPVMHVVPNGKSKGTILLHGGNDSYFEEFLFTVLYLKEQGFEVYMFEGPGQGGVVRNQGKHFTYEWERPVKAVLDGLSPATDYSYKLVIGGSDIGESKTFTTEQAPAIPNGSFEQTSKSASGNYTEFYSSYESAWWGSGNGSKGVNGSAEASEA